MTFSKKAIKNYAKRFVDKIDEKGWTLRNIKHGNSIIGQGFYTSDKDEMDLICISKNIDYENDYLSIYYLTDLNHIPIQIDFNESKNYFEIMLNSGTEIAGYEMTDFIDSLRLSPRFVKKVDSLEIEDVKRELEKIIR